MRINRLLLVLFLVSFGSFAQERNMTSEEISTFKKQMKQVAQNTETIKSDFVQYKHLDFLDNDIESSGKLSFKAPEMVKWEYTQPFEYSVIFKGSKLYINDGGTKSNVDIGSNKMFQNLNELIVNSVKGDMFDEAEFTISYFSKLTANKAIFIPKDKNMESYIASFELLFNKKDGAVMEVKMIEPSGDFTRIVFNDRILNTTIPNAIFNQ